MMLERNVIVRVPYMVRQTYIRMLWVIWDVYVGWGGGQIHFDMCITSQELKTQKLPVAFQNLHVQLYKWGALIR